MNPDGTGPSFWIQSSNLIDPDTYRQTYQIELTGEITTTYQKTAFVDTKTFKIEILNNCVSDTLTLLNSGTTMSHFADYTYYINENTDNFSYGTSPNTVYPAFTFNTHGASLAANTPSGALTHQRFYFSWQTSEPYCPTSFEIKKNDGTGTYVALSTDEAAVVSLIDAMAITVRVPNPAQSNAN